MTETAQPKWTTPWIIHPAGSRTAYPHTIYVTDANGEVIPHLTHVQDDPLVDFIVRSVNDLPGCLEEIRLCHQAIQTLEHAAEEQRHATEPGCACLCHADNTSCPYCEGGRHLPARSEVEGLLDSIGGDAYLCAQGDMEPVAAMVSIQKAVAALRSLSARPEVETVIRAAWDHSCALDGDTSLTELHAALLALLDSQRTKPK